jgi:hypothetical protein
MNPSRMMPKRRKTIEFQTAWRLSVAITLIWAYSQFSVLLILLAPIGIVLYLLAPGILLLPVAFTLLLLKGLLSIMRIDVARHIPAPKSESCRKFTEQLKSLLLVLGISTLID